MLKKLSFAVLTVCLLLTVLIVPSFAAESATTETTYTSGEFQAAVNTVEVSDEGTIVLNNHVEELETVTISKSVTIDLNGYYMELEKLIVKEGASLTIENNAQGDKTKCYFQADDIQLAGALKFGSTVSLGTKGIDITLLNNDKVALYFGDSATPLVGANGCFTNASSGENFVRARNGSITINGTYIANGNHTVGAGEDFIIKANGVLTIKGEMTVAGELTNNGKLYVDGILHVTEDGALTQGATSELHTGFVVTKGEAKSYYGDFATALTAAAAQGGVITFESDVTIDEPLVVSADLTINGNGHTLTYIGSGDRVIEVANDATTVVDLTISNLTVVCNGAQRGINYNDDGTLTLNNVDVSGATYALNMPGKAYGAVVTITDSSLSGNIALNVWGKNCTITATNSDFISVDNTSHEGYTAISLNNDGETSAEGTTITINGGSIVAKDENGDPSIAVSNATTTGTVTVSNSTAVTGTSIVMVAVIRYPGNTAYTFATLQDAINEAATDNSDAPVSLLRDIALDSTVTVPTGEAVTLDLNGMTVTGTDNTTASFSLFTNKGNFTIDDTVGGGKITLKATNDTGYNRYRSWPSG